MSLGIPGEEHNRVRVGMIILLLGLLLLGYAWGNWMFRNTHANTAVTGGHVTTADPRDTANINRANPAPGPARAKHTPPTNDTRPANATPAGNDARAPGTTPDTDDDDANDAFPATNPRRANAPRPDNTRTANNPPRANDTPHTGDARSANAPPRANNLPRAAGAPPADLAAVHALPLLILVVVLLLLVLVVAAYLLIRGGYWIRTTHDRQAPATVPPDAWSMHKPPQDTNPTTHPDRTP
ncbi:MAG: hypothetical protein ACE5E6_12020 [Phycisphaerae bacterium]